MTAGSPYRTAPQAHRTRPHIPGPPVLVTVLGRVRVAEGAQALAGTAGTAGGID